MRSYSVTPLYYEDYEAQFEESLDYEEVEDELFGTEWEWADDAYDEYDETEVYYEEPFFDDAPDDYQEMETYWDKGYLFAFVLFIILLAAGAVINNARHNIPIGETIAQAPANLGGAPPYSVDNPTAVSAPYKEYTLTQGLHGQSYGHLAIDIANGRGSELLSPINGFVTELYVDEYNNTTLVIENDIYQVMMLHGDFSVAIGDELQLGQVIGVEGNNGYTMDMFGNLCYGRPHCGNHTHLNIYDKRIQANVNPLNLIQ